MGKFSAYETIVVFNKSRPLWLPLPTRRLSDCGLFPPQLSSESTGPGVTAPTRRPKCHRAVCSAEVSQRGRRSAEAPTQVSDIRCF